MLLHHSIQRFFFSLASVLLLVTSVLLLVNCGGSSSGGSDFIGAGEVTLQVSPRTIDVGDRLLLTIDIKDAIEDGIQLKIRFPDGLGYVPDSGSISNDSFEDRDDVEPDVNAESDGSVFLVFFINDNKLDENGDGNLQLQLVGRDRITDGQISVDIDVDDPLVDNNDEFDVENPEFQSEASQQVTVLD